MGGRHRFERLRNLFKGKGTDDEPTTATLPLGNPPPPSIPKPVPVPDPPPVNKLPEDNTERNKLQEELWNEAYDTLRESGDKYILEYEEILLTELKSNNPDVTFLGTSYKERWRNMQLIVGLHSYRSVLTGDHL
jgi:hypothetical protein